MFSPGKDTGPSLQAPGVAHLDPDHLEGTDGRPIPPTRRISRSDQEADVRIRRMQRALVICPSDASSDRGLQEIAHEQGQSMLTLWNSLILKACSHGIVMGTKLSRFE
jgi:hypothetical protein